MLPCTVDLSFFVRGRRVCEAGPALRLPFSPSIWTLRTEDTDGPPRNNHQRHIHDACLVLMGVGAFVGAWVLVTQLQGM